MHQTPQRLLALILIALTTTVASAAPLYDLGSDFTTAANPSGAWSFGSGSGANFTPFTSTTTNAWLGPVLPSDIAQQYNSTSASITKMNAGVALVPTAVLPNDLSQSATVRWIAPAAGTYEISAQLEALTSTPNGTQPVATIYQNGTSLETRQLEKVPFGFFQTRSFNAGETLDFVNPPNIPQSELGVGLRVTIQPQGTQVPLPVALYAFFPTAALAAVSYKRLRRR